MNRPLPRRRVAVLISGRGSNMAALVDAARAPDYPAEIVLVISNRAEAAGLELAQAAGIATSVIDHSRYGKDRERFEWDVQRQLDAHGCDIVCLAGFMRLLSPSFVERWDSRLINIHPSLLPAFTGLDTHARALQAGVKIHGASVHFVTADLDAGPIIAQAAVPVLDTDTTETLAARVLATEHRIYPLALRLVAEQRVRIVDGRCFVEGATADGMLAVPGKIA
jgi:phosphoribosylglycinamide formyltransferase-1